MKEKVLRVLFEMARITMVMGFILGLYRNDIILVTCGVYFFLEERNRLRHQYIVKEIIEIQNSLIDIKKGE